LIKKLFLRSCCDISDIDGQHTPGVRHDDVRVDFKISFPTVANKYEPPFREVTHDSFERAPFPLGGRLKYAL
jgi:hypothetical protein